jgi:hypothetical protein
VEHIPSEEAGRVAVLRAGGRYALVARERVAVGSPLFTVDGELRDVPSRYSLQVGVGEHLDLPDGCGHEEIMDRFFWRFMNHSCEPNAMVDGCGVSAVTDIEPGEEITFHYNTTEWEMAEPFDCECGSGGCEGRVAGYANTSPEARKRIAPWLAAHLRGGEPSEASDEFEASAAPAAEATA